jgi:hypothetical protein
MATTAFYIINIMPDIWKLFLNTTYSALHMSRNGHCERADGHQRRLPHACHLEALHDYQFLSIAHAQEWTL